EALGEARQIGVRAAQHQALGRARAQLVELTHAPRREPPRVTELIEAQYALDQHQRVLDHEVAVPLPGLFEQHHLEPPGTVIERQDDARAALLYLIDESGDGHRPAGAEAPRPQ